MKSILSLSLLLFLCKSICYAQYFSVKAYDTRTNNILFAQGGASISYKIIVRNSKSSFFQLSYPIRLTKNASTPDTVALIKELLKFKGDDRLCCLPIISYNPAISQIYSGELSRYSIQLEALFIINQLFFKHPFAYSPYPILYNWKTKSFASANEKMIADAYDYYQKWTAELEKKGLYKCRVSRIYPLDKAAVQWYP
jgi:hypothetical protein